MFGLRPTGLKSFSLTPRLADGWDKMALHHVKAFGTDFDIEAEKGTKGLVVRITNNVSGSVKTYKAKEGTPVEVKL
jgi:hypothetical protein